MFPENLIPLFSDRCSSLNENVKRYERWIQALYWNVLSIIPKTGENRHFATKPLCCRLSTPLPKGYNVPTDSATARHKPCVCEMSTRRYDNGE